MPHSPRMYDGKLYVLNSGTGELCWVEPTVKAVNAKLHVVAFCPGFVRGLGFHGKYAFVGLSKPRYERLERLALDKTLADADSERGCGIQVIDLETGSDAHWFRIDGAIGKLYDVAVVPGVLRPMSLGFASNEGLGLITNDEMDVAASFRSREVGSSLADWFKSVTNSRGAETKFNITAEISGPQGQLWAFFETFVCASLFASASASAIAAATASR
jgi:hypothetical protein